MNEYGTFLQLSKYPKVSLWGRESWLAQTSSGDFFFSFYKPNLFLPTPSEGLGSRQSNHWSHPCPSPGSHSFQGQRARGPPASIQHMLPSPQCSKEQTDPVLPSPHPRQEGSNAPSFADYLFVWRDRNDVKVYLEISISLYIFN